MRVFTALVALALPYAAAQVGDTSYNLIASASSNVPTSTAANYSCVFINRWTSDRHPALYPSDAHWSRLVVVSHSASYQMWDDNTLASGGVQIVAEVRYIELILLCNIVCT